MPDRAKYLEDCRGRWSGIHFADARRNWDDFQSIKADLLAALKDFKRNPFLPDLTGKCHNPNGTLTAMLWNLQSNLETDRSCLYPLLDFEENFQKVFLRRGLIIYCAQVLRELEVPIPTTNEPCLNLK